MGREVNSGLHVSDNTVSVMSNQGLNRQGKEAGRNPISAHTYSHQSQNSAASRGGATTWEEKLYVDDCAALTVKMMPGIPPSNPRLTAVMRDISGVIGGELPFQLRLKLTYGHRGWAYCCPECERRAFILYFAPHSIDAQCQYCLRLSYRHND
jgi:hypothetical protein